MSSPGNPTWPPSPQGGQPPAPPASFPPPPAYPAPPQAYSQPVPVPPGGQPRNGLPNSVRPLPVPVSPVPVAPVAIPAAVAPVPVAPVAPRPVVAQPVPVATPSAAPKSIPVAAPSGGPNRSIPARPIPVKPKGDAPIVAADEDEEQPEEQIVITPLTASPWLVSMIVHVVLILILALIWFNLPQDDTVQLEAVYAEAIGEQLQNDILDMGLEDPDETEAALSLDVSKPVDDPLAAPPQIQDIAVDSVGMASDIAAPAIGLALTGRETGSKKALLAAYGGTATTEASVKMGLEWLKKNQRSDGTWSLQGPYSGAATTENVVSATAMALLAFQGAGHTPVQGEFKSTVAKGWKAMLAMQDRDGNFVKEAGFNQRLYAQAQATIAICELYGMTKDSRYAAPAELAIQYALKAQSAEGGWRYSPGVDSDTSVTGWFVMALQSARMAKMEVPQGALDNVSRYLDSVANQAGDRYSYQRGRNTDDATMTAEALLCRQYLGWKRNDPRLASGADFVLVHPLEYGPGRQNVYYWYYATQFLHHMENPYWNKWNSVMRQAIPTAQIKTGEEKGSWSPADDEWGSHGGRLYVTCLSIYMLEVYYRHLPLYTGAAVQ